MKKIIVLALVLGTVLAGWGVWQLGHARVTVNGQTLCNPDDGLSAIGEGWGDEPFRVTWNGEELAGPTGVAGEVFGVLIAGVVLCFVALLLAFIFAGVGLILFCVMLLVAGILMAVALPFLIPLLIPLLILWAIFAGIRRIVHGGTKKSPKETCVC